MFNGMLVENYYNNFWHDYIIFVQLYTVLWH